MPFVGVVTIEEDAEQVWSGPDAAIFKTRVSFRSSESFAIIDKEGKEGKSRRVFLEAGIRVRKFKEDGGEAKLPFGKEDLVKGTLLEVSGDIGVDTVLKQNGEKGYYTKLKVGNAMIVGKRPEREASKEEPKSEPKAESRAPAKKGDPKKQDEKSYAPRKLKDPGDAYPEDAFI